MLFDPELTVPDEYSAIRIRDRETAKHASNPFNAGKLRMKEDKKKTKTARLDWHPSFEVGGGMELGEGIAGSAASLIQPVKRKLIEEVRTWSAMLSFATDC